jgi:hypothetical protein
MEFTAVAWFAHPLPPADRADMLAAIAEKTMAIDYTR